MKYNFLALLVFAITAVVNSGAAYADTFGTGGNQFTVDFSTIGNPGNAADTTGYPNPVGAVSYTYRIGTYEVSEDIVSKANVLGNLGITTSSRGANKPATNISWNEAARFVNWLNVSEGFSVAYKFTTQPGDLGYSANANVTLWQLGDAGYDSANPFRNSNAHYFLPSMDEWYKAAYYDAASSNYFDYTTGSNSQPIAVATGTSDGTVVYLYQTGPADVSNAGGLSPYGTMAQGGNAWEWNENNADGTSSTPTGSRMMRGGNWSDTYYSIINTNHWVAAMAPMENDDFGFRVASISVPEPSTWLLLFLGLSTVVVVQHRRRI